MRFEDDILEQAARGELDSAMLASLRQAAKADSRLALRLKEAEQLQVFLRASHPKVPRQRMWKGIQRKLAAGQGFEVEAGSSLWQRLQAWFSTPHLSMGFAVAASLMVGVGLWWSQAGPRVEPVAESKSFQDGAADSEAALKPAQASRAKLAAAAAPVSEESQYAPQPEMLARAEKKSVASVPRSTALAQTGMSEVEKALLDQQIQVALDRSLTMRPTVSRRAQRVELADFGGGNRADASLAAAAPRSMAAESQGSFDATPAPDLASRIDSNGFWDFSPAARALNLRQWEQAASELELASRQAPEEAERSFAASSLRILTRPGAPLAGWSGAGRAQLDHGLGLEVEQAKLWQVLTRQRVATYRQALAHLPGYRAEAPDMIIDMTFNRASFGPGTRFEQVSDDAVPAKVFDAQNQAVTQVSFDAPQGADYWIKLRELRIK